MASGTDHDRDKALAGLWPQRAIARVTTPLARFLHIEAASGVLLLAITVFALILANTAWGTSYRELIETRVTVGVGSGVLDYPLWYWVNDGLMTLFFFVVGLEIKRELTTGELTEPRKAALPVLAALGGAALPAVLFIVALGDASGQEAWAVPMATDIAFVVGALALFGSRVPHGLKIFVLTLAIVDDLLAVLIIAFFYSHGIDSAWLGAAAGGFAAVVLLRVVGVRAISVYAVVGIATWVCVLKSGLHPTLAGVVLGLMTPARPLLDGRAVGGAMRVVADKMAAGEVAPTQQVHDAARETRAPLERLESALHPWVAFVVLPIFVFVNAGVSLGGADASGGLAFAIGVGLVVGKPLGITLVAWLAVRLKVAQMIDGVSWPMLFAASILCGVGFTMSLFIASLGLDPAALDTAKLGILIGSGAALIGGIAALAWTLKRRPQA